LMRILHLIQSAPEVYGAERCALLELAALRRHGLDARAVVLCETRMGAGAEVLPQAFAERGVPVERVRVTSQVSLGMMRDLVATLRRMGPAVIHSHSVKTDILGYLASRLSRQPLIIELHGWVRPEYDRRL